MEHLFKVALYEGIWRTIAAVAAAFILILCLSNGAASALLIAAHVALLFTILMIRNAAQLVDMAKPQRAQANEPITVRMAGNRAAALTLGFAKAGSAIAAGFSGLALVILALST